MQYTVQYATHYDRWAAVNPPIPYATPFLSVAACSAAAVHTAVHGDDACDPLPSLKQSHTSSRTSVDACGTAVRMSSSSLSPSGTCMGRRMGGGGALRWSQGGTCLGGHKGCVHGSHKECMHAPVLACLGCMGIREGARMEHGVPHSPEGMQTQVNDARGWHRLSL